MDLIKRQLFTIICGVASAAGIALAIVGTNSMSSVKDGMTEATSLATRLPRLRGGPDGAVNLKAIRAQEKRIETIQQYHEAVLEWSYERDRMAPLVADCFPNPDRDQKVAFRDAYLARFDTLREKLRVGVVATTTQINDANEQIQEEAAADRAFGVDLTEAGAAEQAKSEENTVAQYASGLLTDHGARTNANARANLIKARSLYCYADAQTFEVFKLVAGNEIYPDLGIMWDAQLSLWIQESVVDALSRINNRAAEAVRADGQSPWVGALPVKDIISIRTSAYVVDGGTPNGFSLPYGSGPAFPSGSPADTFTHAASNALFEVVQFSVKLTVDARKVPMIVDELCKDNFHTLVHLNYESVEDPSTLTMDGKIYGSIPVVRIVLDFETAFFGEIYHPMMPNVIRTSLGLEPLDEDE